MIAEGAAQQHLALVWFLLAAGSAGVFLHAGIKFPWFVFFQKDSGLRPADPPWNMRAAMILCSVLCIGIGMVPGPLYSLLPFKVDYVPYTASHVLVQLQLLLFSGLAFFLMLGLLKRTLTITLDVDWLWRRLGRGLARGIDDVSERAWDGLVSRIGSAAKMVELGLHRHHGPDGIFGRTWPTGTMAFWTTVMLGAYLILAYV